MLFSHFSVAIVDLTVVEFGRAVLGLAFASN